MYRRLVASESVARRSDFYLTFLECIYIYSRPVAFVRVKDPSVILLPYLEALRASGGFQTYPKKGQSMGFFQNKRVEKS